MLKSKKEWEVDLTIKIEMISETKSNQIITIFNALKVYTSFK